MIIIKKTNILRWDLGFIFSKDMSPVLNPYHSRDRFCNYELQELDFYPESIKKEKWWIKCSEWYKKYFHSFLIIGGVIYRIAFLNEI